MTLFFESKMEGTTNRSYPMLQAKDSVTLLEDNTKGLETRSFDEALSHKYQGEAFNYDLKDGEAQNLLERFLNWFFGILRDTFGIEISPGTMEFMQYLIYVLMGALVIYLLVRFFVGQRFSSVFVKQADPLTDLNLQEAHIEEADLDALITQALTSKNYRLAIRYQYLQSLKFLSQHGFIEWHYEKTNRDYQREIKIPGIQALFKEVSYLYDHIWYGEQTIDAPLYAIAEQRFGALHKQLES